MSDLAEFNKINADLQKISDVKEHEMSEIKTQAAMPIKKEDNKKKDVYTEIQEQERKSKIVITKNSRFGDENSSIMTTKDNAQAIVKDKKYLGTKDFYESDNGDIFVLQHEKGSLISGLDKYLLIEKPL